MNTSKQQTSYCFRHGLSAAFVLFIATLGFRHVPAVAQSNDNPDITAGPGETRPPVAAPTLDPVPGEAPTETPAMRFSAAVPIPYAPVTVGGPIWVAQGPGPTTAGQAENCMPNNQVVGAVRAVAAHPTDPDTIYVGGTNGGIWKTTNFTALDPNWMPLTDQYPSLSTGCLEFDPTDGTNQTLVAGIGRFSSSNSGNPAFASVGGALTGLLKTTNGGATWTELNGGGILVGKNISGVAARGPIIVVAVTISDRTAPVVLNELGIFRSTNGGATFAQVSGAGFTGLPQGRAFDLAGHRNIPSVLYTGIRDAGANNGVYKSTDTGASWTRVSNAAMNGLISDAGAGTSNIKIAIHFKNNTVPDTNPVYVAILNGGGLLSRVAPYGAVGGIFRSGNGGGAWAAMGIPSTTEAGGTADTNPGGQGGTHFSIAADPTNENIVYVGGDRQPDRREPSNIGGAQWPNSLGARDYSGRLFRGDASLALANQWVHLTHSNALGAAGGGTSNSSAPHADSRRIVFDADNNLIEGDDGGIYERTSPKDNTGRWFSGVGDSQLTEFHSIAYDSLSNIIIGGAQDTGVPAQSASGSTTWNSLDTADGGDVAVDNLVLAANNFSSRFFSTQSLGSGFPERRIFSNANAAGLPITSVNNVSPIVINTAPVPHTMSTGDRVVITGVMRTAGGLSVNANRFARITVVNATSFSLNTTVTDGPYVANTGSVTNIYPALNPLLPGGGAAPAIASQFITPIAMNAVAGNRIVLGGSNSVYESTDGGCNITRLQDNTANNVPVNDGSGHRALSYGGRRGSPPVNNPDILYVGSGNNVFVRTAAPPGSLLTRSAAYAGGFVRGIAMNRDDWMEAFVVDANARVFRTTNAGGAWNNITGNLFAAGALHCVDFVSDLGVVVGTDTGVFISVVGSYGTWNEFGTNLPNAPVFSLQYNPARDVLIAGTLGRGAWRINNATGASCCLPDGYCVNALPDFCIAFDGEPGGVGSVCPTTQLCCMPNGTCIDTDPACCASNGGVPGGPGTACAAPQSCCMPDGTCVDSDPTCCTNAGGTPGGPGTSCAPQACCLGQICLDKDPLCCTNLGGVPQGAGSSCATINCPEPPEACCFGDEGPCQDLGPTDCANQGGTSRGAGTTCATLDPPCAEPPQACCIPDGGCTDVDEDTCVGLGGTPQGPDSICAFLSLPCPQPPQACCLSGGGCSDLDPYTCSNQGGTPYGSGTSCATAPCGQPRTITQWRSVRTHSSVGELGIVLDPTATGNGKSGPTSETRDDGIQKIEVDFSGSVTLANPLNVTVAGYTTVGGVMSGPLPYTPVSVSMVDGDTLEILFNEGDLPDQGCYIITINPGTIVEYLIGDTDCAIRSLIGDAAGNGIVNTADMLLIKSNVSPPTDVTTAPQLDLNLNGSISTADMLLAKSLVVVPSKMALCP